MAELEGQMSLFNDFEYTRLCEDCHKVWSSTSPFPNDWTCPACNAKEKRVLEG